ncbi:potassium-transporting ATPase subunit KdpA [Nocardia sp. NPDC003482]
MSTTTAGIVFVGSLVIALALVHVPLGDYMFRVYTSERHSRAERLIYRGIGVRPGVEQSWAVYARSALAFSAIGVLFLFFLQLAQGRLPLHLGDPGTPMTADLAWNTAISFVTNTNWQNYAGESTLGHLVQMAGLAVQNFVSAAVGMAVAIALVRGFARTRTGDLGNFWVDLVRGTLRILLPIAFVFAIVLVAGGVVQNFHLFDRSANTVAGAAQSLPGGPVASQEVIKELGTNGGGFFNVNSAHPFENPTAWTNWVEIFLLLVISFSLPRTFGRMVGSPKQGYAIASVMAILALLSVTLTNLFQLRHHGTVPTAVGAAMEGVETRFGVSNSATFAAATTLTSTGAVDSAHDSYTSLGGLWPLFNMQLGEVAPGGTGSGLYGMLILAVITVFVAGLMVGRTPEYLGKKITPREIKLAATYFLVTPLIVLTGTAVAMALPGERAAMANGGPHGLTEVLYAFTSAANNNGSAFAGLSGNTVWWNTALGLAMVFGRFVPIVFVLALAGSLARQGRTPASIGTLPTHRPQFVGMVVGVTIILVALTFLPALALGPLAEGIHA